jgi:hypothetical protein
MGATNGERAKAEFFAEHMKEDLKGLANTLTLGLIPGLKAKDGEPEQDLKVISLKFVFPDTIC